jgi:hypothetical protein
MALHLFARKNDGAPTPKIVLSLWVSAVNHKKKSTFFANTIGVFAPSYLQQSIAIL